MKFSSFHYPFLILLNSKWSFCFYNFGQNELIQLIIIIILIIDLYLQNIKKNSANLKSN